MKPKATGVYNDAGKLLAIEFSIYQAKLDIEIVYAVQEGVPTLWCGKYEAPEGQSTTRVDLTERPVVDSNYETLERVWKYYSPLLDYASENRRRWMKKGGGEKAMYHGQVIAYQHIVSTMLAWMENAESKRRKPRMTIEEFKARVEGIGNDFTDCLVTRKMFHDQLLDLLLEVCGHKVEQPEPCPRPDALCGDCPDGPDELFGDLVCGKEQPERSAT